MSVPPAGVVGGLPDGRAYEQVSPVEKNGNEAGTFEGPEKGFEFDFATPDGEALLYYRTGAFGKTASNVNFLSVGRRTPDGWRSEDALPAPLPPLNINIDTVYQLLPSTELSSLAFESSANWVSANPAGPGEQPSAAIAGAYLFKPVSGALAWIGEPVISNPSPAKERNVEDVKPLLAGASPNLNTLYFSYDGTLLPEDASRLARLEEGVHAPGFYEYRDGVLHAAGLLPTDSPFDPGAEDPYGSEAAAYAGVAGTQRNPALFNNEVSVSASPAGAPAGSRAFFVSPAPDPHTLLACREAAKAAGEPVSQCTPELYVREGGTRTVLVSRDEATGEPASEGVTPTRAGVNGTAYGVPSYAYAAPDGARVFFESASKLAKSAAGEEPAGSGPWTYEFELESERLVYLPAVNGPILASSQNGSRFIFQAPVSGSKETKLELWDGKLTVVARLPAGPALPETRLRNAGKANASPAHGNAEGTVFVFQSDAPIPGFGRADEGGYEQVFRYTTPTSSRPGGQLTCVSCVGEGAPSGNAMMTHDDGEAGNPPFRTVSQDGGVAASGNRVFFDTPEALVAADTNGVRDVYEWEAPGEGSCPSAQAGGCRFLISAGTSEQESFLVGSSESGSDVFFATTSALSPLDTDGAYDIYDARAPHHAGEQVAFPLPAAPVRCASGSCQTPGPLASAPRPASFATGPSGNLRPPAKKVKGKAGGASHGRSKARARRRRTLRHALRRCRRRFGHNRHHKRACNRRARRRYGARGARAAHHAHPHRRRGRRAHRRRRHDRHAHRHHATKGRSK